MTAPAVVLVHGLWHGAWCWDAVAADLDRRGIASTAVDLPLTDLDHDTRVVRDAVERAGRPVVLVGHSYGGAVVTAAGTHPLVRELVYLAAFALDTGESVSRTRLGADLPATRLAEALVRHGDEIGLDPEMGRRLLYADVPPAVADVACARLRPVSRQVFRGVPDGIAWRSTPSTHVVCTRDEVIHPDLQRAMAHRAGRTVEWACGHSPQAARPAEVADLVARRVAAVTG